MNARRQAWKHGSAALGGDSRMVPPLREFGADLVRITRLQRIVAITIPFLCVTAYFYSAVKGWWYPAVLALMCFSFFTYGSTSHDLVHRSLGLPRIVNDLLLSLIELLALRSGHAYRLAHLHHHARFPHEDDIEGGAARMSLLMALLEGPVFQFRIWLWALKHANHDRIWIRLEGVCCLLLFVIATCLSSITPIFFIYAALVVMGSWLFPLITAYVPHDPDGQGVLFQTRAFRGVVASVIAFGHLYHLEHHLYPAVPHQNWPKLAKRLDSHLAKAGVQPIKFWF